MRLAPAPSSLLPLTLAASLLACADPATDPVALSGASTSLREARAPASPPTAAIAYVISSPSGNAQVAVINADGTNKVIVSKVGVGRPPSWSGSGAGTRLQPWKLAYNTGNSSFTTADIDTTGGTVNVRNARSFTYGSYTLGPRWKPGQDSILFSNMESLMIVGAGGGTPAVLYSEAGLRQQYAAWRSDGSAIAFAQYFASGGARFSIRVLNRRTDVVTTIVEPGAMGDIYQLDWARTRDEIAFTTHRAGEPTRSTWVVSLVPDADGNLVAGGAPRLISSEAGWPSWSPDDRQLVIAGLRIVDYATGAVVAQLSTGGAPDWRR